MVDPVISLDGLGKRFGRTVAVNGISMAIGEGEIFGFLGANGAGKTTTIRMLCGLTRSTRGHGTIHGLDIWSERSFRSIISTRWFWISCFPGVMVSASFGY